MSVDRSKWPPIVRFGLMGVRSRGAAWAFFWLCIVIGVACVAFGFVYAAFFQGGIMFFAALAYYLSIRWVDQHSQWG